jgi:hypothetical protein
MATNVAHGHHDRGILAYGIVRWPDAPIHPCGQNYCGKPGPQERIELIALELVTVIMRVDLLDGLECHQSRS